MVKVVVTAVAGLSICAMNPFLTPSMSLAQQPNACGPVSYSVEDQRYTTIPCAPPAPAPVQGVEPCGPVSYSFADQAYATRPCPHPSPVEDPTVAPVRAP